jgi:tryptophan halogenase
MKALQKIVIVGGGSAGWIAAAILANKLNPALCRIELIESEEIGTIGVGESTIPLFVDLLQQLEIDEIDFIKNVQASFKLGIEFVDWKQKGESYFHPFGLIRTNMESHHFYQAWLKGKLLGSPLELQQFSACRIMAQHGRFFPPRSALQTPLADAAYALHLDANLVAKYLRRYAEERGVIRTEGKVVQVLQKENQFVEKVILSSGIEIGGDFFVDCTGFRALLIEKTMGVGYHDWSHYLPCNRAVAVQTKNTGDTVPFTCATARDAGWTWRIPLQHRTGNGYVYSSQFCSDEEATATLLSVIDGEPLSEPRVIPFLTGVREQIWFKNCLSVGLASGFIEPLESTAIHLVMRGVNMFLRFFPDQACDQALANEYNRRMLFEYEEIRDFIVLHYCLTEREDTAFWQHCKSMEIPDSLQKIISLFKSQGDLPKGIDVLFHDVSWWSVCEGMGLRPAKYNSLVDNLDYETTQLQFKNFTEKLEMFIKQLPTHDEFIRDNCSAFTL